jgi:hypothetical protein
MLILAIRCCAVLRQNNMKSGRYAHASGGGLVTNEQQFKRPYLPIGILND